MNDSERDELIRSALDAQKRAFCPYSNFPVGAALRTASGRIYQGVNVENASFGLTICAERVAASAAVAAGEREFTGHRRREPRRRFAVRRLPAVPGRVQPEPADRDGRLAQARAKATRRRSIDSCRAGSKDQCR